MSKSDSITLGIVAAGTIIAIYFVNQAVSATATSVNGDTTGFADAESQVGNGLATGAEWVGGGIGAGIFVYLAAAALL